MAKKNPNERFVSYLVKLIDVIESESRYLIDTININSDCLSFLIDVIEKEWDSIKLYESIKDKLNFVESLIHETKKNPTPKYGIFDKLFYKFPSYLRRSTVSEAIGIVSSYNTRLEEFEAERYNAISNGKKFKKKKPKLSIEHNKFPTFFKDNMFNRIDDYNVEIKVYKNYDWVWLKVKLRKTDVDYLLKWCRSYKELNPTLVKVGNNFKLKFPFKFIKKLPDEKPLEERKVCTVDLGINTSAVCSISTYNGTVLARAFFNPTREKDHMNRLINRVSKLQYMSGRYAKLVGIWRKIDNLKIEITNKVSNAIIQFALENGADVIVLENLGKMKLRGYGAKRNRKKIHNWNKRTIINKVKEMAHRNGIRYSLVNPKNTSALAYDGSGKVKRSDDNFSICKFQNGKIYNCDLNASYNIGARYFIREILKSLDESQELRLKAKVPGLARRTECTLATLISLVKVLKSA